MNKKNKILNSGLCQGVLKGQAYFPKENVAKINVKVRTEHKNPKTGKKEIQLLNFVAFGENAEKLEKECADGDLLMIYYHIISKIKVDRITGISRMVIENVIDNFENYSRDEDNRTPYLNRGFYQGFCLSVTKQPNSEGIYILDVVSDNSDVRDRQYFSFTIYGKHGDKIAEAYPRGRRILIEYKQEKSKRLRRDNSAEYFTNLVVERIN